MEIVRNYIFVKMQLIIDSSNVVVFFVQSLNKAYNLSKNIPDCA